MIRHGLIDFVVDIVRANACNGYNFAPFKCLSRGFDEDLRRKNHGALEDGYTLGLYSVYGWNIESEAMKFQELWKSPEMSPRTCQMYEFGFRFMIRVGTGGSR